MSWRAEKLTRPIFKWAKGVMPAISETEREAINAGTVWFDRELFTGNPDWQSLVDMPPARLTAEEQAFLDGPTTELCKMIDDWQIINKDHDLAPEAWAFMREKKFFGMIIPKQYGGLGFSNTAHSEVVRKISSCSVAAGVTVMVPNSLGPGELMLHFGTDAQRDYWMPRLADGREIPCFGLTSPEAGSDAAAMTDVGVVEYGEHEGERVLGIRLNFEKRYITLAPVATVMGLAFKMRDPENHLGRGENLGITVALIPTSTKGVDQSERHVPLNTYFQNGPLYGKDVFIPMDWILGGEKQIGQGWTMLMTALAAGRGISLPSQSSASTALCARTAGAYSRVRTQFNVPIGMFEGIQEPLADIAGNAYLVDAARRLTVAALDEGHKPSVISAIMKSNATYRMRESIERGMDILGGKAIIEGPSNYLAAAYRGVPIAITVEGANILTRSLMIFGQGAIRAHPYMLTELLALSDEDQTRGLKDFDKAFWSHVGHSAKNVFRAFLRGWTGGLAAPAPKAALTSHWRQLSRLSSAFAMLSDLSLLTLGGSLKRREMISGRLGDILSELYLLSASLKRFEDEGRPEADKPIIEFIMQNGINRMSLAFNGVLDNMPARWAAAFTRFVAFPLGVPYQAPSDELVREVADILMRPSSQRDRLTPDLYLGEGRDNHPLQDLERAFQLAVEVEPIEKKMRQAKVRDSEVARDQGVITTEEFDTLSNYLAAKRKVVMVDSFKLSEISHLTAEDARGSNQQTPETHREAAE
ncbi:acyl-CoA dehydrogenase [Fulvimarina sp. 2208YS6-2-32]|uniref:Acyl-coenzyme A dehydrogenase n=1 Tax=Fulvimarina uroteuthidis TaxID=3098149 RepID=A0ABU5HWT0_9HYPH|nr:acyl-CoA dehydrogenase [Fulvimarina sp. 2208YS6-2-32]MDY8107594.1 acyl-CoA dehydrogenase [Fulvimarina sp. 2208YS6-2-32]